MLKLIKSTLKSTNQFSGATSEGDDEIGVEDRGTGGVVNARSPNRKIIESFDETKSMEQSIPFRKKYRNSLCPYLNAWLDGVIVYKSEDGDDDNMDDDDLDDDPDASLLIMAKKRRKRFNITTDKHVNFRLAVASNCFLGVDCRCGWASFHSKVDREYNQFCGA